MNHAGWTAAVADLPPRRAGTQCGQNLDDPCFAGDEREHYDRGQPGLGVLVEVRVELMHGRHLVMRLIRDPPALSERRRKAAPCPDAKPPPKVLDDGLLHAATAFLLGGQSTRSGVDESAGGIEMTTRGEPSARATIAL